MARHKKVKNVLIDETTEVCMTEGAVLESLQTEIDLARVELQKTRNELAEKKKEFEYTTLPLRELSSDEKVVVDKHLGLSVEKKALAAKIQQQKAHDDQKVTGRFVNRRAPGQAAKLTYQKYETDAVKWHVLEDGKVYTIPRGFADQINEHYYSPVFIQKEGPSDPNAPTSQIHDVDTSNKKYMFTPINF